MRVSRVSKGVLAGVAAVSLALGVSPAFAYDVPSSWSESGLKPVVAEVGSYSWSVDGLGTVNRTGTLQVSKPTGGTVHKAYLMAAQVRDEAKPTLGSPSTVLLNGSAVTFELESLDPGTSSGDFNNYFGDVTSLVKSTLDAASVGVTNITIDEGVTETNPSDPTDVTPLIEGTALMVIWNDPAVDVSTIIVAFGNSNPAGDNFSLAFDALTSPQLEDLQLSIGDSYSYQLPSESPGDGTQASSITVNGQTMADAAGGFDDCLVDGEGADPSLHWDCNDGALLSVGGVGDNSANPTLPAPDPIGNQPDDELYSLSPFVQVGSTSIEVQTLNPSSDDNVFFAAFNLKHIIATLLSNELPNTGTDARATGIIGAIASLIVAAGAVAFVSARRRGRA